MLLGYTRAVKYCRHLSKGDAGRIPPPEPRQAAFHPALSSWHVILGRLVQCLLFPPFFPGNQCDEHESTPLIGSSWGRGGEWRKGIRGGRRGEKGETAGIGARASLITSAGLHGDPLGGGCTLFRMHWQSCQALVCSQLVGGIGLRPRWDSCCQADNTRIEGSEGIQDRELSLSDFGSADCRDSWLCKALFMVS